MARYRGTDQNDAFKGTTGDDRMEGFGGNDYLYGGSGKDVLIGGDGNDWLEGGLGNDTLDGGNGNDIITGGAGRDVMTGGAANDIFVFNPGDVGATPARADTITDFGDGTDLIDLSAIDADVTRSGDQAFRFIGTSAFTGRAGELRYQTVDHVTWLAADVDGDKQADGYIALDGTHAVHPSDLVL